MINLKLQYHDLDVTIVGTPANDYNINTGDLLTKIEAFLRVMSCYEDVTVNIKTVNNTMDVNDDVVVYNTSSMDDML